LHRVFAIWRFDWTREGGGTSRHAAARVRPLRSEGRSERGAELVAQRRALAAACTRRGFELVEALEEAAVAMDPKRPGMQEARRVLEGADPQALVARKRERAAQALLDLEALLGRAQKEGWALVALDCTLETQTPAGEALATLLTTFARCERRSISERTRAALAHARTQGVRLGRPPTMPSYAVERIRRERAAGKSLAAIANGLNADRIPTAQGGRRWYPATIRYTLNRTS
jgi:DNA invertase Pin-like site-specific DNA recombinase